MFCCYLTAKLKLFFFFFQAEDGIRDVAVTGVQTCARPGHGRAPALQSGRSGPADQPPEVPARDPRHPRPLPRAQAVGGRLRRADERAGRPGDEVPDQDPEGVRRAVKGGGHHRGDRQAARPRARRLAGGASLRQAAPLRALQPRLDERWTAPAAPAAAGLLAGHAPAALADPDGPRGWQVQRDGPQRRPVAAEHEPESARAPAVRGDDLLRTDRGLVLAGRTRFRRNGNQLAGRGADRPRALRDALRRRADLDAAQRPAEEDQRATTPEMTGPAPVRVTCP